MKPTREAAKDAARRWARMRRGIFIAAVLAPAIIALILLRSHLLFGGLAAALLLILPFPAKLLLMLGDHLFITRNLEKLYL
jgi:hypothetical protein